MTEKEQFSAEAIAVADEVNKMISLGVQDQEFFQALEPDWQKATIRLLRNNSIKATYARLSEKPEEIINNLVKKIKEQELDENEEFLMAISDGLALKGDVFKNELLAQIEGRLIENRLSPTP